jgi:MATE family, multidrug efflux pump
MRSFRSEFVHEIHRLLRLGSPIFLGQLAQAGMGTVDAIMAGNYSATDLAAISIGQSLWLPLLIFFVGLSNATTTTVAHKSGAGDNKGIKLTTRQSLWLALFMAPVGLVVLLNADRVCVLLGVEQAVGLITVDYLFYLAFCLPALTCFLSLRGFCDGQGKTRAVMMINLVAFFCNIPLNYVFIYGVAGIPELGGAGCGLATCLVIWVQLICVIWITQHHSQLKAAELFSGWLWPQRAVMGPLLALGFPIGLTMLAEVALFSCVALIIAPLGTTILAANQVALSLTSLTFMLPLSVGLAINIRAGNHLGANDPRAARFSSLVGVALAMFLAVCAMVVIVTGRNAISSLYTSDAEVVMVASGLLFFAAFYQLPDAVQVCVINALRSFKDTRVPLIIVLVAYWVISIPLGWCLTMGLWGLEPIGAKGMWIGMVCGLTFAAVMLSLRFRQVLARVNVNPDAG